MKLKLSILSFLAMTESGNEPKNCELLKMFEEADIDGKAEGGNKQTIIFYLYASIYFVVKTLS